MFNHNWLFWPTALLAWLLICNRRLGINGQSQNAIGAHREYAKTSFSCTGRPAGYYADVETGCQVYHMCDGLGRQFSYSCPNTTLFQQRMLICDHWYMVNCSKAESDYAANLLIGQRDKPFVNDEENSLRTPRPDLLDRPYAPDYSGESFRNQYKTLPAAQNRIDNDDELKQRDKTINSAAPMGQHWKIPQPSRLILPPAPEPELKLEARNPTQTIAQRQPQLSYKQSFSSPQTSAAPSASTKFRVPTTTTTTTASTTTSTRRPYTNPTPPPSSLNPNFNGFTSEALHQRQDENEDLGTSHSTRYNTSDDFSSAELPSNQVYKTFNNSTTSKSQTIKVPSKFYEPPFLHPIYNENDTLVRSSETPFRTSSAAPFTIAASRRTIQTTTQPPFTRPTTQAGRPFSKAFPAPTTATLTAGSIKRTYKQQSSDRYDIQKVSQADTRTTETASTGFKSTTQSPSTISTLKTDPAAPELPAIDLLPPFPEIVLHDTATTVGPPIYYEWKIPSNGLEPPKLDPPIGVDGREYPDAAIDYNSISANDGFVPSESLNADQQQRANSFQSTLPSSTSRTPFIRSVKTEKVQQTNGLPSTEKTPDISQIRKELSLPEYSFPLESIGRTGYLSADTYNSFQLKIPEQRHTDSIEEHLHWFGENPKCPQCHPSYVVPGTCEPCLRR